MKKLIALGLSTLTAATITLGAVATPAHAVEDPLGVVDTVCDVLGEFDIESLADALDAAHAAEDEAIAAREDAEAAVLDALSDYVNAVVDTLNAVDNDDDVPSFETIMNAKFQVLINKIVAWSTALADEFEARADAFSVEVQQGLVDDLNTGLGGSCLPVL